MDHLNVSGCRGLSNNNCPNPRAVFLFWFSELNFSCLGIYIYMNHKNSFSKICDRLWEKVRCRAYFQNRVIGTKGLSKLSAIKCTTCFVVKVTFCGVMAVSVQ